MNAFLQIQLGIRSYFSALGFLSKHGLLYVFIFPVLLSIFLFSVEFSLFGMAIDPVESWIMEKLQTATFIGEYVTAMGQWLWWIISVILHILFFLFFSYTAGFIMLIIMSPLLAWLSEQIEIKAGGNEYPVSVGQILSDALRGASIAARNLVLELSFALLLLLLGLVPVIGWAAPVLLFFISSYYYGFSFLDYTNERHRRGIRESIMHIHMHKWLSISIGAGFALMMLIPWLGFLLAGFAAIISTTAATLAMLSIQSDKNKSSVVSLEKAN